MPGRLGAPGPSMFTMVLLQWRYAETSQDWVIHLYGRPPRARAAFAVWMAAGKWWSKYSLMTAPDVLPFTCNPEVQPTDTRSRQPVVQHAVAWPARTFSV